MNIRLAWRFTQPDGMTTTGVGRWMRDTPAARELLQRTLENAVVFDPALKVEKWVEEDATGVHDEQAAQSSVGRDMSNRTVSSRGQRVKELVRVDYQWDAPPRSPRRSEDD